MHYVLGVLGCRKRKRVVFIKCGVRNTVIKSKSERQLEKQLHTMQVNCEKSQRQILSLKERLKEAENLATNKAFHKTLENMSPRGAELIRCQFREIFKSSRGKRFTLEEKILCLSLYKKSPRAYKYYKEIFCLPSSDTLNNLLKLLPLTVGTFIKI